MTADRRRLLWIAGAAALAVHAAVIALRRAKGPGDFDVSREFGRRFLAGEDLYGGGLHYPYLPSAAMLFSPLALLPPWLGFALRYAVALGCLALAIRLASSLSTLAAPGGHERRRVTERVSAPVFALVLCSHYIVRDLDDAGPHLILLAVLVAGFHFAAHGRRPAAGLCFGLAAAAKAPGLLALPYLWLRRERRLFAWTLACTLAWIASPALWMGAGNWWDHQWRWLRTAAGSAAGVQRDAVAAKSEDRIQNQSLRAAVARNTDGCAGVETDGERICSPSTGARLAGGLAAALLIAGLAWHSHRLASSSDGWLREGAIVMLAMLLLSPVTWVQHLVLCYPALAYLGGSAVPRSVRLPRGAGLAAFAVLALVLNRELLGRENYFALLAAGSHTAALLILLLLLVAEPAGGAVAAAAGGGSVELDAESSVPAPRLQR